MWQRKPSTSFIIILRNTPVQCVYTTCNAMYNTTCSMYSIYNTYIYIRISIPQKYPDPTIPFCVPFRLCIMYDGSGNQRHYVHEFRYCMLLTWSQCCTHRHARVSLRTIHPYSDLMLCTTVQCSLL